MSDLNIRNCVGPCMPLDDTLARLQFQASVDLGNESNVTTVDRHWASLTAPINQLDDGDLFFALAHPSFYGDTPEVSQKLQHQLGYNRFDRIQFKTFPLSNTAQLAMVVIEPEKIDPSAPPIIFGTGFAHPSALYVRSMEKLAKEMQCKVILFDQPGNGGSQSASTVNQVDFYNALKEAIRINVPEDGRYYVAAHSLGSSGAYQLFNDIHAGKTPVGNRRLVRMMLINPIPTKFQESTEKGKLARTFLWSGLGSQVAHGFTAMRAGTLDLFDNGLSEYMRPQTRARIAREQPNISLAGVISTLGNLDLQAPLDAVGHDDRLVIVLGKDDQLMNWDVDAYQGKRGYYVINSDHGGLLIDGMANDADIKSYAKILTQAPDPKLASISKESAYRSMGGIIRLGLLSTTQTPSMWLVPELTVRRGLTTLPGDFGIFAGGGFFAELGHAYTQNLWHANTQAQAFVGIEHLRLPIEAQVGIRGGVNYIDPFHPFTTGAYTTLRINAARIVDLEAQVRWDLHGHFQDFIAGLRLRVL